MTGQRVAFVTSGSREIGDDALWAVFEVNVVAPRACVSRGVSGVHA
jgi:hypothetical protein